VAKISQSINSDSLFHFIKRCEWLLSILKKQSFQARYVYEDIPEIKYKVGIPMKCFCDIPLGIIIAIFNLKFNLKYLLAILNSSLSNYLYKNKFKSTKKVFSEIQANSVEKLPIKKVSKDSQQPFIDRAEKILSLKKQDTSSLEKEIDVLVYKLYELTYDEVKIIDKDFWLSEEEYEKLDYGFVYEQSEITESVSKPIEKKTRKNKGIEGIQSLEL